MKQPRGRVCEQKKSSAGPYGKKAKVSAKVPPNVLAKITSETPKLKTHVLTDEQVAVIAYIPKGGDTVIVNAYAGSGKTSTCDALMKSYPQKRWLYLVFNKIMQTKLAADLGDRLKKRTDPVDFEKDTVKKIACQTTSSLALEFAISQGKTLVFEEYTRENCQLKYWAKRILDAFLLSDESEAEFFSKVSDFVCDHSKYPISDDNRQTMTLMAKKLWGDMIADGAFTSHQAYIKYFTLHPDSANWLSGQYDCIIVDEAQDTTLSFARMLTRSNYPTTTLYLVGDTHQGIYQFNKCVDIMRMARGKRTGQITEFALTQSFRFGSKVAEIASSHLSAIKGDAALNASGGPVQGSCQVDSRVLFEETCDEKYAVISRTNKGGFVKAHDAVKLKKKVFFLGDTGAQGCIASLEKIMEKYGSKSCLRVDIMDAEEKNDYETLRGLKLLESYKSDALQGMINMVNRGLAKKQEDADVIITTCHRSKGLEFDNVMVSNELVYTKTPSEDEKVGEAKANLLYVAMTRCKKKLYLPKALEYLIPVVSDRIDL